MPAFSIILSASESGSIPTSWWASVAPGEAAWNGITTRSPGLG